MRLTTKTTVALLVAFCTLLGAYGLFELERQTRQAEEQMRSSQRTLGRLFRPNIARTWRLDGEASALYLIEYTKQTLREQGVEGAFDLRWVWLDGANDEAHAPLAPGSMLQAVRAGDELTQIIRTDKGEQMVSYVPVPIGREHERAGALEIRGSLASLRSFEQQARRRLLLAALIGAGALALLSLAIGAWFVGRPARRLLEATERIGSGDLRARVHMRQRDELGRVGRSFDAMARALEEARERAERASEDRVRAVEQMRHADRLITVGKLASGVAHELGTPLAVVAGRARLIASGATKGDELVRSAESIGRQTEKMAAIIRQLLDFARRRAVTLTPKDLNLLIRQTLEMLAPMADKQRVELRTELPEKRERAAVDGSQIQQVLTNLVVNAIHATPAGGEIVVRLRPERRRHPERAAGQPSRWVCISVSDTGVGMEPEVADRVFEPFFTTKDVGKGTGLGLSVSHGIVSEHGGWIEVESAPGEGSCFSIFLPRPAKE